MSLSPIELATQPAGEPESALPGDFRVDDVIELELFHPDEAELPPPPSSRGLIPATVATVILHIWLLATLQGVILSDQFVPGVEPVDAVLSEVEQAKKPEIAKEPEYTLVKPNDRDVPVQKVLNANSVGVVRNRKAKMLSPPDPDTEKIDPKLARREVFDIPEGVEVSRTVVVQGTTGNSIIQLESALDRVTYEIAMHLKERRVLVVWLLDASASLQQQREVIAKRLKRIYGELDALKTAGQIPKHKQPLLTGVVGFGQQTEFLTPAPTMKFDEIEAAVKGVKIDESGRENVFTAVLQTMQKWGRYNTERQIMFVVVTDESGDDFAALEPAIKALRRKTIKAYVIGPSAVFGRRKGYVPYVAPENNRTYQIPVDLGPESPRYENVLLPFWFEGPQHQYLTSGYGPYGLSRLVKESGGVYFTTNTLTMSGLSPTGSYETEQIKPFQPDYRFSTPEQYDADVRKHPLRYAVRRAAILSRDNQAEGTPSLDLRVTPQNFRQMATTAQQTVARSQLMIDTILEAFPRGIERQLDKEPSPRWRMNFCLTYGRLLAMRVRCLEYNSACADLKTGLTPQDVGSNATHWIFRPSEKINYATGERRNAKLARELLERCVREAPGTPWATLAERELRHPLGIRIIKRFIPPPKPRPKAKGPARKQILLANDPRKPRPKPQPKPKPVQPKLPKY
jgi:hypothetical protein